MLNPFDSASGCLLALKAKKVKPKPKRSKVWSVSTGDGKTIISIDSFHHSDDPETNPVFAFGPVLAYVGLKK